MRNGIRFATVLIVAGLAACVQPPPNYEWGTYDETLYEYYKDSQNADKLVSELERLSVAYEMADLPDLGEVLTRAESEDAKTRRKAVGEAALAMRGADLGSRIRLAPGMLPELGYLYLQSGNPDKAVALFQREKRHWPESAYFMDVMIRLAKGPARKPDSDGRSIEDEAARLRKGAPK